MGCADADETSTMPRLWYHRRAMVGARETSPARMRKRLHLVHSRHHIDGRLIHTSSERRLHGGVCGCLGHGALTNVRRILPYEPRELAVISKGELRRARTCG